MKRAGCLFLTIAPVATLAVYLLGPEPDAGGPDSKPSASQGADGLARETQEELEERIKKMPPGLAAPDKKELAQQIVASAENSTLDWKTTYGYIEDIGDGNGYTAGIVGFCSGTHDMLKLVEQYTEDHPDNGLAKYLPALRAVDGTDSHEGLDGFPAAWKKEAERPEFREAQDWLRDDDYFDPAVRQGKMDGLNTLGQFVYYDAMVMHGPGTGPTEFYGIREEAMQRAKTKAEGGKEEAYLKAFLDVRREVMQSHDAHRDTSRIDTAQAVFLKAGNLRLDTPLEWRMYGDAYRVK
ncbi:chitosanase [Streptomyces sp. TRM66268-LWL]|uniref:Chitosanase n=1 Tax=Streptomyces polyasparticus TaxID=2767826 RepID=A0ABR7SAU1_9ACTN|nr:chitosanase [Streptomyces polyasparticus]MBC9712124.1 chitosanase [Streptomyces polyasparticus]